MLMRRAFYLPLCLFSAWVGAFFAQGGIGPIGNLQGRVDSNNALVVTAAASGTLGSAVSPIANLPGKVDSSNNLLVTIGGGTGQFGDGACGTTPSIAFVNDTDTGFYLSGTNTIGVCANGAGPTFTSTQVNLPAAGQLRSAANGTKITFPADGQIAFANNAGTGFTSLLMTGGAALSALAPTTNGTIAYCNDCLVASDPCTASSTGAMAFRLNGRWRCQ